MSVLESSIPAAGGLVPKPSDKFSFGLWTVGWPARDPFGDPATRPALTPVEAVHRLAELGAYGLTFHDDDLFPFGSDDGHPRQRSPGFKDALEATGLIVPMVDHQPVHPPGVQGRRVHQQRPRRAPVRAAQDPAQPRPGRRARRGDLRVLGRPRRQRVRRRQGHPGGARALPRGAGPAVPVRASTRATTCGSRSSRSPTSRAATSCCPTVGHALAFIATLEHPEMVGVNPETGHEQMAEPELRARHRPGALAAASCSTST